jgi:hypothetical protein
VEKAVLVCAPRAAEAAQQDTNPNEGEEASAVDAVPQRRVLFSLLLERCDDIVFGKVYGRVEPDLDRFERIPKLTLCVYSAFDQLSH